jgi:hypothetical protein
LQEANTATKLNEALGKVREFIERPAKKVQKGTGWGLKLERPSYDEARNILRDAERISPVSRPDPNLMDDLARGVGKVTTFKPRPIRLGRGIGGRAAAGAAVGGAVLPMFLDWAIPEKWRRDPQQPPKR